MDLLVGAISVTLAAFLGGVTGFGYSLVATPLLLLIGFPLPFVVTANLAVALVTRISVAYRFRQWLSPGRVLLMARDKASPRSFLADLAMYFVSANAIGLIVLAVQGAISEEALTSAFWL